MTLRGVTVFESIPARLCHCVSKISFFWVLSNVAVLKCLLFLPSWAAALLTFSAIVSCTPFYLSSKTWVTRDGSKVFQTLIWNNVAYVSALYCSIRKSAFILSLFRYSHCSISSWTLYWNSFNLSVKTCFLYSYFQAAHSLLYDLFLFLS